MNPLGKLIVKLVATFRLGYVSVKTCDDDKTEIIVMSNLTLINFVIHLLGPMHERTVTQVLVVVQVNAIIYLFSSCINWSAINKNKSQEKNNKIKQCEGT